MTDDTYGTFAEPTDREAAPARRPRLRRVGTALLATAVLSGAVAVAWVATRSGGGAPTTEATGHVHGGGGAAAGSVGSPVTLTAEQADRIGVTYATAELAPMAKEIRALGRLTFDERRVTTITLKVDGFVERLHVAYTGQQVRAGEPLMSIYSPMLVAAQEELLLARRLATDVAGGTPEAARGATDLVGSARRRLEYLDVPASEIAAIESRGVVRRALTIVSPVSGFVLEKNVEAGQQVMAGAPLYRVGDLRVLWVEGEVFEQDLAGIRTGQLVHVDLQALPGEHHMGRITYVYPTLDPETRTAKIRVELPNPQMKLKPGMYATLRIEAGARDSVLTVPRSSVLVTGERTLVFVRREDGRLDPRDVRIGESTAERVEILAGLGAGERVVSSATFLIDAESNLGSAIGGMQGVDTLPAPVVGGPAMRGGPAGSAPPVAPPATTKRPEPDPHAAHRR